MILTRTRRRRRRYPGRRQLSARYTLSRSVTFAPGIGLPLWGWFALSDPAGWYGLAVLGAAGILLWPVMVLSTLFYVPSAAAGGCFPRSWRIRYRQAHGREGARSAYISKRLRNIVFAADRWRCVHCHRALAELRATGSNLNADHIIPWAGGGLTTLWNLMTLCRECNLAKSNYSVDSDGYEHYYAPKRTTAALVLAAQILASEKRHRWNLLRMLRAAWALGW